MRMKILHPNSRNLLDNNQFHCCICRWNKKCRSRVYTVGDIVTPLNKYHTHEEIIHRKKRVTKKKDLLENDEADYILVQPDKKETSEDEDSSIYVAYQ